MNFPTLLVGQANPERDAQLAEAMAATTAQDAAHKFKVSRSTVRDAAARHHARREFDLFLESVTPPSVHLRVCHVVTTKPFVKVALAAYRAYPGTLKKLEVPGWVLTDGAQRCTIADLQQAMRSKGKTPESAKARKAARERLGMEA